MAKAYVTVAKLSDVPPGQIHFVDTEAERVVLCNVDGRIYAVEDVCTHDGGPLEEGFLEGCAIECPRHGAQFDVRTGEVLRPPAYLPIRTFPVRMEDDHILVEFELD
jgi:nitrite reductase/ring-hydroxylating ferredoxin subunit